MLLQRNLNMIYDMWQHFIFQTYREIWSTLEVYQEILDIHQDVQDDVRICTIFTPYDGQENIGIHVTCIGIR